MVHNNLKTKIQTFLLEREGTFNLRKNIIFSFLFKGISVVISFLIVPMTINFVNPTQYGIWIALSSIILWLNFFDIGLGNGLKNKLAETNALGDTTSARMYVSTTYAILTIISSILFALFLIVNRFLSWNKILNATNYYGDNLNTVALMVVGFFCLQFVIQLINIVLTATHSAAKVSLNNAIGQCCSIFVIFILTKVSTGSLYKLVFALSAVPLFVQLLASGWYYKSKYKLYSPSFKFINFSHTKELLSMGGVFFVIQIGALVLLQTDNIVVTQLFGPKQLTNFNIAYKMFSIVSFTFSIIMYPFWSAFTDAYTKGDLNWIKRTLKKMYRSLFFFSAFSFLLLALSSFLYQHWVGNNAKVPFLLSFAMCLYVIGYCWVMLSCYLLNGTGKMRLQLYLYVATTIVNIPLAIYLAKYFGLAGVTFSNVIVFAVMCIVFHIQCKKVLNKTAVGIWNK